MKCPKCRLVEMRRNRKDNKDIFICLRCGHEEETE